jgi:hypothetical protein
VHAGEHRRPPLALPSPRGRARAEAQATARSSGGPPRRVGWRVRFGSPSPAARSSLIIVSPRVIRTAALRNSGIVRLKRPHPGGVKSCPTSHPLDDQNVECGGLGGNCRCAWPACGTAVPAFAARFGRRRSRVSDLPPDPSSAPPIGPARSQSANSGSPDHTAFLEARHRHAGVKDYLRCGKATGLDHFPPTSLRINAAWCVAAAIAQTCSPGYGCSASTDHWPGRDQDPALPEPSQRGPDRPRQRRREIKSPDLALGREAEATFRAAFALSQPEPPSATSAARGASRRAGWQTSRVG